MNISLNNISDLDGSKSIRRRVGRGTGNGRGKTCGRGMKGQKSRSGVSIKTEGGQMPIIKRCPKRGFNPVNKKTFSLVSLLDIYNILTNSNSSDSSAVVDHEYLISNGVIDSAKSPIKLVSLKKGQKKFNFDKSVQIKLNSITSTALSILEKAGGSFLKVN
ncbi:MAG TPA: 50S ribosomal protein L15 [Candidatus Megaira endosymbiont of Hartmannula sinica]|nr:50S ribosomal protein L15 [Candidatus Megaera endosymbiont of Hartmannula sinica]